MRKDLLAVLENDRHVSDVIRGTHIGVFDNTTELPSIYASGFSVRNGITWLYDHDVPKNCNVGYILVDSHAIREKAFPKQPDLPPEDFSGHAMFCGWWRRRKMIEAARPWSVRLPTFKEMENDKHFHFILNLSKLPIYRMITAAIATNVFLYKEKGYDVTACTDAFFKRFPSLNIHRTRVEQNLKGDWLEKILPATLGDVVQFNVNQLTGK